MKRCLYCEIIEECVNTGDTDNLKGIAEARGTTIGCVRNYLYYDLKVDNIALYNRYKDISKRQRLDKDKVNKILNKALDLLVCDNNIKSVKYYLNKVGLDGIKYSSLVSSDLYKNSDFVKEYKHLKFTELDTKALLYKDYLNLRLSGKSIKDAGYILGMSDTNFNSLYKSLSRYKCRYKDVIDLHNKLICGRLVKYDYYISIVRVCINKGEYLVVTCKRYNVNYNNVAKFISYALENIDKGLYDKYKARDTIKSKGGNKRSKGSKVSTKTIIKWVKSKDVLDSNVSNKGCGTFTVFKSDETNQKLVAKNTDLEYKELDSEIFKVTKISLDTKNLIHIERFIKSTSYTLSEYCDYAGVDVSRLRRFVDKKLNKIDKDLYLRYKQKVGRVI